MPAMPKFAPMGFLSSIGSAALTANLEAKYRRPADRQK
jgi:hypothetical protein